MKVIFFIGILSFSVICDAYDVNIKYMRSHSPDLKIIEGSDKYTYTFGSDVQDHDNLGYSAVYFHGDKRIGSSQGKLCSCDVSSGSGSISALVLASLGMTSCPIKAGSYAASPRFKISGVLPDEFMSDETQKFTSVHLSIFNSAAKEAIILSHYHVMV